MNTNRAKKKMGRPRKHERTIGLMTRLPPETHAELVALAERSGESLNDLMITAVEQLCRRRSAR